MSWVESLLHSKGLDATILDTPPVPTRASVQRLSQSRDAARREAEWTGYVLAASGLVSGKLLQIGSDVYLVQSTTPHQAGGELVWFGALTNCTLTLQRLTETDDGSGNLVEQWTSVSTNVKAWGQAVTAALRQTDAGLLSGTTYLFELPGSLAIKQLDRLIYRSQNLQVDAVDDVAMNGVVRVQCGVDVR